MFLLLVGAQIEFLNGFGPPLFFTAAQLAPGIGFGRRPFCVKAHRKSRRYGVRGTLCFPQGQPACCPRFPGGKLGNRKPCAPHRVQGFFLYLVTVAASAVSQLMQRAEVFHRESRPAFRVTRRPEIAGQASGHAFAAIVYLD